MSQEVVLTTSRAIDIAEGVEEVDEELQIKAWQHLIDTGCAWTLQGWFGRSAINLIEDGICTPTPNPPLPTVA